MDYIKSKITGFSIYWFCIMLLFPIPVETSYVISIFKDVFTGNIHGVGDVFIHLFLVFLFIFLLIFLKHIKYILIKENELKYFSLFFPFGKTLNFSDYIGKIITTESGSAGSYKVVYLVDKNHRTAFKIMGLHYKNFDEMNNAIPLKKISFSPAGWQYFKLLFFERITIETKQSKKPKGAERNIAKIFAIISVIGIVLFVIGMIVRIISKIL